MIIAVVIQFGAVKPERAGCGNITSMCLILFAYRAVPGVPLIVAANRDERFDRAAAPAAPWEDHPEILAGRDLIGSVAWAPVLALRAAYAAASKPELRTTDGEELMFCKSHFTATNMLAVRRHLAKAAGD